MILRRLVLLLSVLLPMGSCSESASTSTPDPGEEPRLAVLSPALGLILIDLGLEEWIVARHAWDQFLPKSLPSAGDQSAIEYETLLAARPTQVLLEWGNRELPPKLNTLAEHHGWQVHDHTLLTLEDIVQTTSDLATRFNVQTTLPDRLAQSWQQQPPQSAGTVLLLIQRQPEIAALGPGSAHHQILTRLGFTPALSQGAPYQVLSFEDLAKLNPDHIVMILPGSELTEQEAEQSFARLDLDARFHVLTGRADLIPSARLLGFTHRLRNALRSDTYDQPR